MPRAFEELYERCISEEAQWRALLKLPPECMLRIIKLYLYSNAKYICLTFHSDLCCYFFLNEQNSHFKTPEKMYSNIWKGLPNLFLFLSIELSSF